LHEVQEVGKIANIPQNSSLLPFGRSGDDRQPPSGAIFVFYIDTLFSFLLIIFSAV